MADKGHAGMKTLTAVRQCGSAVGRAWRGYPARVSSRADSVKFHDREGFVHYGDERSSPGEKSSPSGWYGWDYSDAKSGNILI
jgi:L-amino acid N-acyltransferase YncA